MQPLIACMLAAPGILEAVDKAVKDVEVELPAGGSGAQKLDAVHTKLKEWHDALENKITSFEQIWPSMHAIVEHIVALYNSWGVFKKSA